MSEDLVYVQCPFCKERIVEGAVKCRHCGSFLVPMSDDAFGSGGRGGFQSVNLIPKAQNREGGTEWIRPERGGDRLLGHGWSLLLVVVFNLLVAAVWMEEGDHDAAVGLTFFVGIFVIPWFIWLVNKVSSNKVLPLIGIAVFVLTCLSLYGNSLS